MNDTPSVLFKLNLWTFVNLRVFKFKFARNLFFFISGLNGLKLKSIMYNYRDWNFEHIFFKCFKFFFIFMIFIFFI